MLAMLLGGPFGVVDNPVGAPVIFQDLFVDETQNLDSGLHMVGSTVRVTIDHLDVFVQR